MQMMLISGNSRTCKLWQDSGSLYEKYFFQADHILGSLVLVLIGSNDLKLRFLILFYLSNKLQLSSDVEPPQYERFIVFIS